MIRLGRAFLSFAPAALAAGCASELGPTELPVLDPGPVYVPEGLPEGTVGVRGQADASVWAGLERDVVHGDETSIQFKTNEDNDEWGYAFRRAYLKFDVSGVDVSNFASAHVALAGNLKDGVKPVMTSLFAVSDDSDAWDEMSITWETQPERREEEPIGELEFVHVLEDDTTFEAEGSWHFSTDLLSEIAYEVDEGNGTLTLRLENPTYDETLFFSREHPMGLPLGPRLVLLPK